MKTVLASLAAVAAVMVVAAPAAAQPYDHGRYERHGDDARYERHDGARYDRRDGRGRPGAWQPINQRQAQLDRRIELGLRRVDLTRPEAARLRAEFRQIARLEMRYRANGLTRWERADLDHRLDRLTARIRFERRDRAYGYGHRR